MAQTTGVLLDVTDQSTTIDGEWTQIETRGFAQILAQITMTGNGTVVLEGRLGPGHSAVQLLTTTDADTSGLVNGFPQMRGRVTAIGAPTDPSAIVSVASPNTSD